jgi:hypothetical protein
MEENDKSKDLEINKNICPHCNGTNTLQKIDKKYFTSELLSIINFEKGFLYTIKGLLISPKKTIDTFLFNNRNTIINPIKLLFLTSLLYSIVKHYLSIEIETNIKNDVDETSVYQTFNWFQENIGYSNLLLVLPISIWCKLFFKKSEYNIYEISVAIIFITGADMFISSLLIIINYFITNHLFNDIASYITVLYNILAIGLFFYKDWTSFVKSSVVYLLGTSSFIILALLATIAYVFIFQ